MVQTSASEIKKQVSSLAKKGVLTLYKVGLEKESLRTLPSLTLDTSEHPSFLGSPLFNPFFTLDFAKSQLEWTTPAMSSFSSALTFLKQAQAYCMNYPSREAVKGFWPYSMPMKLKKCPEIADFGSSYQAQEKKLYRRGLCHRYGSLVQTICGIHLNLSFDEKLFRALHKSRGSEKSLSEFTSESYFHICRNYLRFGWLISYLFGASPFSSQTLPGAKVSGGTYLFEKATSLRMSRFGYYSRIQEQMGISYNSLKAYKRDITTYLNKSRLSYTCKLTDKKGEPTMLNDHYLQIPNEHYARIRPKSSSMSARNGQLQMDQVDYLEVRSLDLNPLDPLGIDQNTCQFLHLFLLMCLLHNSPDLTKKQNQKLTARQHLIALSGRDNSQRLCSSYCGTIAEEASALCKLIEPIATAMDKEFGSSRYTRTLKWAQKASLNSELTHSGQLLKAFNKAPNFTRFTKDLLSQQQTFFMGQSLPAVQTKAFDSACERSQIEQLQLETQEAAILKGYEHLERSTQVLIRAALKKGLEVEVIDARTSLIKLSKGKKEVTVKQATITDLDSYLTYALMEDKELSKQFLKKAGVMSPEGGVADNVKEAATIYDTLSEYLCVIKPLHTNYGIGIHFIDKNDHASAKKAIDNCLALDSHVMIEKHVLGKEYRFLVIDNKVLGVIYRAPANVTGDGCSTIKALIEAKNQQPHYYRAPYFIKLGTHEKAFLAKQGLKETNVPQKGQTVYLRENSNVSTGGDPIDVTDQIPAFFHKAAIKAAKSCKAKLCGVDMIIPSLKAKSYAVIEINFNPAIFFHAHPYQGKQRDPGGAVLKLLGF